MEISAFLIVTMLLNALLGLTVYLPLMAGQLSLASPGFYVIGGYVSAIISTRYIVPTLPDGAPYPIEWIVIQMLIAGVICALVALIIGVPSLRLRGIYLALATIAFVKIVEIVALNLEITGKSIGIFGIPQPFVSSDTMSRDAQTMLYYGGLVIPLLIFATFFIWRLERSRVGRAFSALREDELAAGAMGINPTYYKVLAFVMGAVLAGMVGAITAHLFNTWNPRQSSFDSSILFLAFVIIGGSRTLWGPIVGGILLSGLPEFLRGLADVQGMPDQLSIFLKDGRFIVFGLLIAVGTQFFPQGIITPNLFKRRKKVQHIPSDNQMGVANAGGK
jgi:branched-chain amino acid transport system permease protein